MTDEEFDVMDELYFVQSFSSLKAQLSFSSDELRGILAALLHKGWIKCFYNMDDEVSGQQLDFENQFENYSYLATKQGLLEHNGR